MTAKFLFRNYIGPSRALEVERDGFSRARNARIISAGRPPSPEASAGDLSLLRMRRLFDALKNWVRHRQY
jgi:hypothetical protein